MQTRRQLDEVMGMMRANIEKLSERSEKLEDLASRAEVLDMSSQEFQRCAGEVRRKKLWKAYATKAGQYIGAGIHCAGRGFSESTDGAAGVMVTRVDEADILEHLLSDIKEVVRDFAVRIHQDFAFLLPSPIVKAQPGYNNSGSYTVTSGDLEIVATKKSPQLTRLFMFVFRSSLNARQTQEMERQSIRVHFEYKEESERNLEVFS
ncbi:Synaptobrevin [Ancylostoma duodenale]|uniref:Synaptobrevin n=1 Tax=Ancylostoma duodenale TaxID=51022 RepID=A0A0C2H016_9BILA|nr:Synaptobrevin [Ancylostoma duodenale]